MKKKILFIGPFPPPVHGASLRNQSIADSKLINKYFDLKIFCANQASDVHDIGHFSWRKVFKTIEDMKNLVLVLLSFKPDLVYFNISLFGFALYRDALYATVFKIFRFKLLYHLRTQGVREQVEKSKFKKLLFHYLFHNVDIICLSRALYQDIALVFDRAPIIVNNGIAIEEFPLIVNDGIAVEDFSQQLENNPNKKITNILFLSNYGIKKGINELLSALRVLKQSKCKFKAKLIGKDFDYTANVLRKKIALMELDLDIEVVGPLYGEEKHQALHEADIFVLPTYFEAFPGVILEAMQFGLPVVSTWEGAIPEIVDNGKTGLLVEKKNSEALAQALTVLVNDPVVREKMGQEGQQKFFQNFTLETFEKNMVAVFNQVLSNK